MPRLPKMASSLQGSPFLKYIKAGIIKKLCAKNIKCDINTGALKKKNVVSLPRGDISSK